METTTDTLPRRSDSSPWNWLLIVPAVVPLLMFVYPSAEPRLFGFPLFYWLQLSFILLSVATTSLVYRMTRAPKGAGDVA
jgi:hypothetical protein